MCGIYPNWENTNLRDSFYEGEYRDYYCSNNTVIYRVVDPQILEQANQLLEIPDVLMESQGTYSHNSQDYIDYREQVGNVIETLSQQRV